MSSMFAVRDRTARDQTARGQTSDDPGGAEQCRIMQLEQQVEGLTRALQNRDTIGQAKGILLLAGTGQHTGRSPRPTGPHRRDPGGARAR